MKNNLLSLLIIIILIGVWLFPVWISFITWNFWYIFLYFVWWVPALFISGFLKPFYDTINK